MLFDGTGVRSETGRIRKAWREHLRLTSDAELRDTLSHLRILERDIVDVDRELERELQVAGLAPVPTGSATHPYVDLILGHVKRGETEFDAAALRRL